jgi:hypothetical protein
MAKKLKKNEKIQIALFCASVVIMAFGFMFLVNAMEVASFFPHYAAISNVLGKYIIVILTMSVAIMMFSNVAATLENKKMRNGFTIGITTFATVMTLPLVYVFVAIFPYQAAGLLGPVGGAVMGVDKIAAGFVDWFGNGAFVYVVYAFMLVLSIIFISVPLISGVLAVSKDKTLKIGKQANGKFGIGTTTLPVVARLNAEAEAKSGCSCSAGELKLELAADEEEK